MPKSKSPARRKAPGCETQPDAGKRLSRFQPAVGQPLHKKPKAKDLKRAGGATAP